MNVIIGILVLIVLLGIIIIYPSLRHRSDRDKAIFLRNNGMTYRKIAKVLRCSPSHAYYLVNGDLRFRDKDVNSM